MNVKSLKELCLEVPLYKKIFVNWDDFKYNPTLDCYCIYCEDNSVFKKSGHKKEIVVKYRNSIYVDGYDYVDREELLIFEYICSRNPKHTMIFYIYNDKENGCLYKIGQHPSMADIAESEIQNYREILSDEKYREFSRAVGLNAHGIGIGSFVYLRRIFESLIKETYDSVKSKISLGEKEFKSKRMDKKIEVLKDYLPDVLVRNKKIYPILSLGIHELKEDECLGIFNKLKVGIELILDEKIKEKEKEQKIKIFESELTDIQEGLKSKGKKNTE